MAVDIEIVNGLHPDTIIKQYEALVREVRRVYPWSRVIQIGHVLAGDVKRMNATRRLNALIQHIDTNERLVTYIPNNNARLRDNIHITMPSKTRLCSSIASVIMKPHLESLSKFR